MKTIYYSLETILFIIAIYQVIKILQTAFKINKEGWK